MFKAGLARVLGGGAGPGRPYREASGFSTLSVVGNGNRQLFPAFLLECHDAGLNGCQRRLWAATFLDLEFLSALAIVGDENVSVRGLTVLPLADAINSFNSVILWSALSPRFKIQDLPGIYGVKVFI